MQPSTANALQMDMTSSLPSLMTTTTSLPTDLLNNAMHKTNINDIPAKMPRPASHKTIHDDGCCLWVAEEKTLVSVFLKTTASWGGGMFSCGGPGEVGGQEGAGRRQ